MKQETENLKQRIHQGAYEYTCLSKKLMKLMKNNDKSYSSELKFDEMKLKDSEEFSKEVKKMFKLKLISFKKNLLKGKSQEHNAATVLKNDSPVNSNTIGELESTPKCKLTEIENSNKSFDDNSYCNDSGYKNSQFLTPIKDSTSQLCENVEMIKYKQILHHKLVQD